MSSGEEKGWEILSAMDPGDVCKRARAVFDREAGLYSLKSFDWNISVSPGQKKIFSEAPGSELLLQRLGYFSKLSILWYLVSAMNIPLSGQLIKPVNLKGGQLFFQGTHILPFDRLAEQYSSDTGGFLLKGKTMGAETQTYGDAAIRLFPLPRIPVTIILWRGDEEFPARADILFDSTCEIHLPLDIIWSIAMMSVLIMM